MSPAPVLTIAAAPAGDDMRGAVMLLLVFALLAIVLVCTAAVIFVLRRGRRMRTDARRHTRTDHVDAWTESGRRAATPEPGAMDEPHQ